MFVTELSVDSTTTQVPDWGKRSPKRGGRAIFEGRLHFGSPAFGYSLALTLVLISGVLHLALAGNTDPWAPFVSFYPAFAIASFLGGIGPGLFAVLAGAGFALLFFPDPPTALHWLAFSIVSPLLTTGFARVRELRDRGVEAEREYAHFRLISDYASDWIFLVQADGRIRYVNQTACLQLGWPAAEMTGRELVSLVRQDEHGKMRALLIDSRAGAAIPAQFVFCSRNNIESTLEVACTGIRVDDELVFHMVARDISERLLIESRLREVRQWESLGVLAGGLAHDFNNLLTAIIGNTSLAKGILPEDHVAVPMLESAIQASERSAELVRLILASSGYRSRQTHDVHIDKIISKLLASHKLPEQVTFQIASEPAVLRCDTRSMETLLWSLIINAVESYGERPQEPLIGDSDQVEVPKLESLKPCCVKVQLAFCSGPKSLQDARFESSTQGDFQEGTQPSGKFVAICIEDQGCGMTSDVLERAFQPFYSTKFTGRGLGLPAVRGIVHAYNGRLWLRTKPEKGTRVEVLLPA